jgi:hypothetical protein
LWSFSRLKTRLLRFVRNVRNEPFAQTTKTSLVNGSIRVILLFFYHAVDIMNKYPCFAKRKNR